MNPHIEPSRRLIVQESYCSNLGKSLWSIPHRLVSYRYQSRCHGVDEGEAVE